MKRTINKSIWKDWQKPKLGDPVDEFLRFYGKYHVVCRKETDDNKFFAEIRHYKDDNKYSFYFCDVDDIKNVRNFFSETISGAKARGNLYLLNLGFYVKNILS
jgi:hypothetical protein